MQVIPVQAVQRGFGQTSRRDAWWAVPLGVFLGLSSFLVYTTWAMFQGDHYEFGPYLSPLYSPVFWGDSPHAWFGARPPFWPGFIPFSPALLILPFPGSFRFTCYYYRGAYYKAFWADPPSCAVGEPRTGYRGENSFPLVLQNIHRYTFYIAVLFIGMLSWDAWKAMWFTDNGVTRFGIGLGTIVLVVNVVLLASYTFGCHAARHLVGGFKDEISKSPACELAYSCTTSLNYKHQLFAWSSLFWVGFSDLYIRLCSMGIWTDLRIL
jgi:hypothetical protein